MATTAPQAGFIRRFLPWALGIAFLLAALGMIGTSPAPAVWMFLCGLILLPPSARFIAQKAHRAIPRWLTIAAGIVGLMAFVAGAPRPVEPPTGTPSAPAPVVATSEPAKPAQPLSEDEQIRQIVADHLKGNNNLDKPYIRAITVEKKGTGWSVFVAFNAGDNLTQNMRKGSTEGKMAEIYTALYTSGKDIETATTVAYFPLVDKYGNQSDGVVYSTTLAKAEAAKVNWNIDQSTLKNMILPGVWTVNMQHPDFR